MLQNLGFDLNASVSTFLNGFHNQVTIELFRYLGQTSDFGEVTVQYAPPVSVVVQQQVPNPGTMKMIRAATDILKVRKFWASWEILPVARINGKGGDLISYLGDMYYVYDIPHDFRQVGWMSVIGVQTFEPRPA